MNYTNLSKCPFIHTFIYGLSVYQLDIVDWDDYYIMGNLGGEFNGELTLQGTSEMEDIEIDSKGMWRFDDKIPFGGKYEVKVRKQSTGHTCTVMSKYIP